MKKLVFAAALILALFTPAGQAYADDLPGPGVVSWEDSSWVVEGVSWE